MKNLSLAEQDFRSISSNLCTSIRVHTSIFQLIKDNSCTLRSRYTAIDWKIRLRDNGSAFNVRGFHHRWEWQNVYILHQLVYITHQSVYITQYSNSIGQEFVYITPSLTAASFFEHGRSGEHLRRFTQHFTGSSNGVNHEQAKACYATELFAPLNDERFKPGQTAQKAGGMLWRAWLSVECALIDDYLEYLVEFDEFIAKAKQASQELERARERWIHERLEQKFKNSKAYKRCMNN
jgi:hypothetical protein